MNYKTLKKGITISIAAQIVSLAVSVVLNLIIPKVFSEIEYSFWQTYLLYISYVGILHFGLLDGLVLRYSQFDYDELDKPLFRSQFLALLILDTFISGLIILFSSLQYNGVTFHVIFLVSIGIITRNVFTYTSYTFQITNRIKLYAILIISQRLFYCIGVILLVIFKIGGFQFLCILDLLADLFGIIVGAHYNKGLYFGALVPWDLFKVETIANISAGIMLLIANWSSQLLTGAAKMVIQWHWNLLTFGKVSFAFSVSSLFLTFVSAVSVVLFPSLKRMNQAELPTFYLTIRNMISPLMFISLTFYFPGCFLLNQWLPNYNSSLVYLGIMLPSIIFSSKVSLLTNNYLKAYRKERSMLFINLFIMIAGCFMYLISAYWIDSIIAVLYALVFVIMARSIISELIVMRLINCYFYKDLIIEVICTIIFILCSQYLSLLNGFVVFSTIIVLYFLYYRGNKTRHIITLKN